MQTVAVSPAPRTDAYSVFIEAGLCARLPELIAQVTPAKRFALVCDDAIADKVAGDLEIALQKSGCTVTCVGTIQASERRKTMTAVTHLVQMLADARHGRDEPVIAIGGGITGDIVGFAAAIYHRGIPFINVPSTLLAMVDASVGGKTGVNLEVTDDDESKLIKNLVGSFHQPIGVYIDPMLLRTLAMRHIRAGLSECVKHAVIADADHFEWIEQHAADLLNLDAGLLVELVHRNVQIKADIVMSDERELAASGGRALLNLGHTFAHALEPVPELGLVHGEAVGLGMIAAAECAYTTGRCDRSVRSRITQLLDQLGLPTSVTALPEIPWLLDAMRRDKKVRQNRMRLVLPTRIGEAITVDDVSDVVAEAGLRGLLAP